MMEPTRRFRRQTGALVAVVALVLGTWAYAILLVYPALSRAETATGLDRSDFYPRWLGTEELLWHGRDPYSPAITAEIQQGMYGRTLAPGDPIEDPQEFAYPLYIVFLLAPFTVLPFRVVMVLFTVLMPVLIGLSVVGWIRALGWRLDGLTQGLLALLGMSATGMIFILYIQQPAVLVAALLAGAVLTLTRHRYGLAGALLALASVKPQASLLLIVWLLIWAASDWRQRGGLLRGFGGTLAALVLGALVLLPTWPGEWWRQVGDYQSYGLSQPLLSVNPSSALMLGALGVLGLAVAGFVWTTRRAPAGSPAFNLALALVCLYTLVLFFGWAVPHQFIAYPAALLVLQERATLRGLGPLGRGVYYLTVGLLLALPVLATGLVLAWGVALGVGGPAGAAGIAALWPWPWIIGFVSPFVLALPLSLLVRPLLQPVAFVPRAAPSQQAASGR